MRRFLILAALLALGSIARAGDKPKCDGDTCTVGEHGTSLHFEKTPSEAARKALKAEKLVFVLHVSGNFEDSELT